MGSRPLTDLGVQMRDSLPPILRESNDYLAAIHAMARELEALEAAIEQVRNQFVPAKADIALNAWEFQLHLPVGGGGATIQQRRDRIAVRIAKSLASSEGREWEQRVTDVVGGGWSYLEHVEGDPSTPPAYTIRVTLPFAPGQWKFVEAQAQIRQFTPAHLDLAFASVAGFVLDESDLDLETFGGF